MSAPNPQNKHALQRLSGLVDRSRGHTWQIENDDAGQHLVACRGDDALATYEVICTISAKASADEIDLLRNALQHARMMLDLRRLSVDAYRDLQRQLGERNGLKAGNFAANAAILLGEPEFWRFLERRHLTSPIHDKAQADAAFKTILGIGSKTLLNTDADAQGRFFALRDDFQNFMNEGR